MDNPVARRRKRQEQPIAARARRTVVCPCHDVTAYDVYEAWRRGYCHPETLKRYTGCYMGPCQGKYCAPLIDALLDELTGDVSSNRRRPSARPPTYPVRLGSLAAPESD